MKGCSFCRVKSWLQLERKLQKFLGFLAGEQCFLFTPQPCSSQKVSYKASHLGFKEAQNNHFQAWFIFWLLYEHLISQEVETCLVHLMTSTFPSYSLLSFTSMNT